MLFLVLRHLTVQPMMKLSLLRVNVSVVILNTINAIDLPDDAQNGEQQHSDDPLIDGLQRAASNDRQYA